MYDLVVLGGGSGGLCVAKAAARVGAKVALVEKERSAGERLSFGTIPSKALIAAARTVHQVRSAGAFGIKVAPPEVDFRAVMARIRAVEQELAAKLTDESLQAEGIDVYHGTPSFEAYDTVLLDGRTRLNAQRFVIATGSRPAVAQIPGLAGIDHLNESTVWGLDELPPALLLIGGGSVAVELAQAFARLGSDVTLLAESTQLLPREDPEVSERIAALLSAEGITIRTGVEVAKVARRDALKVVTYREGQGGGTFEVSGTHLFVDAGRSANIEGLNLDAVGIHADPHHGIEVDDYLQTRSTRILAIGDVLNRRHSAHAAEREAAVTFHNAVLRLPKKIDYDAVPWATFIDPEVASVGLSEPTARELHSEVRVFRAEYDALVRAHIEGRTTGFAKVVTTPSGKILGATVVGAQANLVIQEVVVAMEQGLNLSDLATTSAIAPSYAALTRVIANQFVATRVEKGFLVSAIKWFYGFAPRGVSKPEQVEVSSQPAEVGGHVNGHGH